MFQNQQQNAQRRQNHPVLTLAATALFLTALTLGTGGGPAAARQDAGPATARAGDGGECLLQRVDTQYVRCDDNTGNGVPAPAWVPER
ncbi:hypothetical protein LG324_05410 [Phycicoccus jejuensis]|uniref:hypothetical protein n=1 Tax=Phycicoccus jejuensis TaxID=367299 RepID=UPI00384E3D83